MSATLDPPVKFCQAKSLAARIVSILRPEYGTATQRQLLLEHPYPGDSIRSVLERIPDCAGIYDQIRGATAGDLADLNSRLTKALGLAESTNADDVEELESLVFRTVSFEQVWAEELDDVEKLRNRRRQPGDPLPHFTGETAPERAKSGELCGLCLSGGGVRSATFNLGILQGMAKHGVLRRVDYLSTVSGGGYIGGWLTAWIKREGFGTVQHALQCEDREPQYKELEQIAFLRDYSSYLTPNKGVFTGDTWTAVATWVRNTLLNLIVLFSLLAFLLLFPHLPVAVMDYVTVYLRRFGHGWEELITLVAVACQAWVIRRVIHNLKLFAQREAESREQLKTASAFGDSLQDVLKLIIAPSLASAWLCASRLWTISQEHPVGASHFWGIVLMVLVCFLLLVSLQVKGGYRERYLREAKNTWSNRMTARGLCLLLPLITTCVKISILWGVYRLFQRWASSPGGLTDSHVAVWGMPLILGDYAICIALHIGLMGPYLSDDRREWWSRVAAYLGIFAVAICGLCMACFYSPEITKSPLPEEFRWVAPVLLWGAVTCGGVIAASSRKGSRPVRSFLIRMITGIAPYVFMVGLLISVSLVLHKAVASCQSALAARGWPSSHTVVELLFWLVAGVIGYLMARAVNVNEFSMHYFYRNRLIRTYLGASNIRNPNRLTGFDADDDLLLASLRPECEPGLEERKGDKSYSGPYPILNAALNLVHGDRLSRQERKATSFVFTPRFCGYAYMSNGTAKSSPPLHDAGYRPTVAYAYPDGGVRLGTAMTISGAATSPNAGHYTSTPMAFLLTVFNVRLGWWMGNPRNDESWRRSSPSRGLMYFVRELLGTATDHQTHVYLSDGGHFENLGIYELVRRQCSIIIACDAEEDPDFEFAGLGDAIRKCFIDFGVRIIIDLKALRPDENNLTTAHSVTGEIHYWDKDKSVGKLIYIKASMDGKEPADICAYRAQHDCFPHQSTTEQFFGESQFESYHRLGLHIGEEVFKDWSPKECEWKHLKAKAAAQTA